MAVPRPTKVQPSTETSSKGSPLPNRGQGPCFPEWLSRVGITGLDVRVGVTCPDPHLLGFCILRAHVHSPLPTCSLSTSLGSPGRRAEASQVWMGGCYIMGLGL
jgi:hypothetical protein